MMTRLNRRDVLKLLAIAPAAIAAASIARAEDENQIVREGMFEHDDVLYQPIYERHGYDPGKDLHRNASSVFIEINSTGIEEDGKITNHFNMSPDDLLGAINADIPELYDYYQDLARRRIPVAIGDTVLPTELREPADLNNNVTEEDMRAFYIGITTAIAGVMMPVAASPLMTRHDFLKKVGVASLTALVWGAWKASGTAFFKESVLLEASKDYSKQDEIPNRLLIRLQGLSSDLHPESPAIFIRNLVMARKIRGLGEYMKRKGIDKPTIGFNVGLAHSGIEDFICLPDAISNMMIAYCSQDYVNRSILNYRDFFAATRIVQANENGIFEEVDMIYDEELLSIVSNR